VKNFIEPKRLDEETAVFNELMKIYIPKIEEQLRTLNITIHLFTVRWFMTLFSSSLKQEVFYRIFEIFLNEGWSIIYKVGLTLLKNQEHKIVDGKFDSIVLVLNSDINHIRDIDEFIEQASTLDLSASILKSIQAKVGTTVEHRDHAASRNTVDRLHKAPSY
jgi:protein associated with RNAse G/E